MGVAISLRKDYKSSFFKNTLIGLLNGADADEVIISTGFFQHGDDTPNPVPFHALKDLDKNQHSMISALLRYKKVTLVGIRARKNDPWYAQYQAAIDYFRNEIKRTNAPTKLNCYYHKGGEWHAKIAILVRNTKTDPIPLAALVGSSNLTRSAMSDSNTPNSMLKKKYGYPHIAYNLEADTLIYVDEVRNIVEQQLAAYTDMEYGEIISYSTMPHIYGNKNIKSEADVIMAEYKDINSLISATAQFDKL